VAVPGTSARAAVWSAVAVVVAVAALALLAAAAETQPAGTTAGSAAGGEPPPEPPPPPQPALGAVPVVRSGADITLPMDVYQLSPEQARLLQAATDTLFRRCMAGFGYQVPQEPVPREAPAPRHELRYGPLDPARVAAQGYRGGVPAAPPPAPSLPAQWEPAAFGRGPNTVNARAVPEGGCAGQARRALGEGAPGGDVALVSELSGTASHWAERDSRVQAAFAGWSRCMADAGYTYQNPWQPNDRPDWADPAKRPEQVATAVADVACKHAVNLAGIWLAVETAYQHIVIDENSRALTRVRSGLDSQLGHARDVLSSP
jgi:hypothetical protein